MVLLVLIRGPPRNRAEQNVRKSITRFARIQSQNRVIFRGYPWFSKRLQAANPAMFCFPITSKLLHNAANRWRFRK
jgi:hypothetical protein